MHTRSRAVLATTLLLALAVPACDDDEPTGPMAEAAGTYVATTFIEKDGDVDHLARGLTLTIALSASGTTTGAFFVPEGGEEGEDVAESLAGTWTIEGDAVEFDHVADTFIRDVTWTYDDGTLSMDNSELTVVLTRE